MKKKVKGLGMINALWRSHELRGKQKLVMWKRVMMNNKKKTTTEVITEIQDK